MGKVLPDANVLGLLLSTNDVISPLDAHSVVLKTYVLTKEVAKVQIIHSCC
jgi:hypothetical protein